MRGAFLSNACGAGCRSGLYGCGTFSMAVMAWTLVVVPPLLLAVSVPFAVSFTVAPT